MNLFFAIGGVAIVLAAAASIVHLSLSWMEGRGWAYYRSKNRPRRSLLGLIEKIYQPSIEHVVEEQTSEQARADQAESGGREEPDLL
jgi:hypothetical protein